MLIGMRGFAVSALFPLAVAAGGIDASARNDHVVEVTIQGVHYTLPSYVANKKIEPQNPLCYDYQFFYMLIKDRQLFINGESIYKAEGGENVIVMWPEGTVQVDGKVMPKSGGERLEGPRPCLSHQ
jgi:hypothetical protein